MPFCFLGRFSNIKGLCFWAGGGFRLSKVGREADKDRKPAAAGHCVRKKFGVYSVSPGARKGKMLVFLASFIAVVSSQLLLFSACSPEINSEYSVELPIIQKINVVISHESCRRRRGRKSETKESRKNCIIQPDLH